MHIISCATCAVQFEAKTARRMYCSRKCNDQAKSARAGLTCRVCGGHMHTGSTSSPQGEAAHNSCLADLHGTISAYQRGCRCDACTEANRLSHAKYRQGYKERNGVSVQSVHKRSFKGKHGYWPQRERDWISYSDRLAIYERDEWACYLCSEPTTLTDGTNGNLAPSLDHVQARANGGDDSPSNLRTAHRSCNSRKGAKELVPLL